MMPESRERQALRMMAIAFVALAAYVSFEAARALVVGGDPESSPVGIGLAAGRRRGVRMHRRRV